MHWLSGIQTLQSGQEAGWATGEMFTLSLRAVGSAGGSRTRERAANDESDWACETMIDFAVWSICFCFGPLKNPEKVDLQPSN